MPVAGNNVECLLMQVVDGQLVDKKVRVPSSMAVGVQESLQALRRGDVAFVRMYGSNVPNVRTAWRRGVVGASE